jgi:hypothetical protein
MSTSEKHSLFQELSGTLSHFFPLTLDKAQQELKELLKREGITLQGSAEKKLRDFSNQFKVRISGLSGGYQSMSLPKRKRDDDYTSLLDQAIQVFESSTGKRVQRSAVYALFE